MTENEPGPEQLTRAVVRLNVVIMGVVFGLLCGVGLFVATIWLVLKGGPVLGPHLGLLGQYFPGYTVSWSGSFVGLLYGLVTGFIAGAVVGGFYNRLAR